MASLRSRLEERGYSLAARAILDSKLTIALTGAGISVPSGIPDFRSPTGLWTRFSIVDYGTIAAFRRAPEMVWQMLKELRKTVGKARPNSAHLALAELESMGRLHAVITQNIDHLHHEGGSKDVIEFHGSCSGFNCVFCGRSAPVDGSWGVEFRDEIPYCECGRPLKPDIVLFGEQLPPAALDRSFSLAQRADLILVIGTSAEVAPASEIPVVVKSHGGRLIEMNLAETELSHMADFRLPGDVSDTLPRLVEAVRMAG